MYKYNDNVPFKICSAQYKSLAVYSLGDRGEIVLDRVHGRSRGKYNECNYCKDVRAKLTLMTARVVVNAARAVGCDIVNKESGRRHRDARFVALHHYGPLNNYILHGGKDGDIDIRAWGYVDLDIQENLKARIRECRNQINTKRGEIEQCVGTDKYTSEYVKMLQRDMVFWGKKRDKLLAKQRDPGIKMVRLTAGLVEKCVDMLIENGIDPTKDNPWSDGGESEYEQYIREQESEDKEDEEQEEKVNVFMD